MANITQHTLGPWKRDDLLPPNGRPVIARTAGRIPISATTDDWLGYDGEDEANACLIAASPELLTETQKADDIIGVLLAHLTEEQKNRVAIDLLNRGFHGTEDRARRAAIVKAEGRT